MKLIKYNMKALEYGVDTTTQRHPYYNLGSYQADPSELLLSFLPRDKGARYLCTKSSIIRHDGRQAIYTEIYKICKTNQSSQ